MIDSRKTQNIFKGIDLRLIAEEYGTPCYIYDMRFVQKRIQLLKNSLGKDIDLYYALKANPNSEVVRLLEMEVDGVDVSSGGELQISLDKRFKGRNISFSGPGKSDNEIKKAVQTHVGSISIESLNELKRVQEIASKLNIDANVSIRINPSQVFKEFAIKMGGRASQFGIDEEVSLEFFKAIKEYPNCNFIGFHIYSGTQCLKAEALLDNFKNTMRIVGELYNKSGLPPQQVNFGGGFGVVYYKKQSPLNALDVCRKLSTLFSNFKKELGLPQLTGIIELGRYLIAEAGYYIARVVDKKISRDRVYCILNGGMNHHLAASGNFGQVIRKNFKIINLSNPDRSGIERVTFTGPLCTTIDIMGDKVDIPHVNIGDYIGFMNSGAYAYTASPLWFLSYPLPSEMMIDFEGKVQIVRDV